MKEQKVLQLIEIVNGKMLPISYWTSVKDLAHYLNVSGQAVRNAAVGLCKCKGYIIRWVDVDINTAMLALQDLKYYVDSYCNKYGLILDQSVIDNVKNKINYEL